MSELAVVLAVCVLAQERVDAQGDPLPEGAVRRLGTVRLRIAESVAAVAVSADGKTVAVMSGNSDTVWFLDAASGRSTGHCWVQGDYRGTERSVAFSPDGKAVAAVRGNAIHLVDVAARKQTERLAGHKEGIDAIAWSADGALLASHGLEGTVRVWDGRSGKEVRSIEGQGLGFALAFAGDRLLLAHSGGVQAWNPRTGERVVDWALPHLSAAAFARDGTTVAVSGRGGVCLLTVADGKVVRSCDAHKETARQLRFVGDDKLIVSVDHDGAVLRLWKAGTGEKLADVQDAEGLEGLAMSADGRFVAASQGNSVRLWEVRDGALKELHPAVGHVSGIEEISVSADGRTVASAAGNTVRLWDVATGRQVRALQESERLYWRVAFSPDGKRIATGSVNSAVRIWDASSGARVAALEPGGSCTALAFSRDGSVLAVSYAGNEVTLHDGATGKVLRVLQGHSGRLTRMGFLPAGQLLSTSQDKTLRLWDAAQGTELLKIERAEGWEDVLAIAPDGRLAACVGYIGARGSGRGDVSIRLWETATGKLAHTLKPEDRPCSLAFSPDGRTLACGFSESVELWDVRGGKRIRTLEGHQGDVTCVAFTPDGRSLVSAGDDTSILIWTVGAPAAEAAKVEEAELTAAWEQLAGEDAAKAHAAFQTLASAGERAVELMGGRLKGGALSREEADRVRRIAADLNLDEIPARERATKELLSLMPAAWTTLMKLRGESDGEVRARIDEIGAAWELKPPIAPGAALRCWRAVRIVADVGTPAARKVLEELTGESQPPGVRREAKAALERLR